MSEDTDEENSVDNQEIGDSSSSEEVESIEDDSTWESGFEDNQMTAASENLPDLAECNECSAVFDNPGDLKAHARSHVKTVRLDPNTSENKFYQCFKCGFLIHSKYVGLYKWHMVKNHGIDKPSMVLVPYDPHCRFCSSVISATRNLNHHIKKKHTKIFLQKAQKYAKQKPESQSQKYKCLKCNKQFLLYKSARRHRNNKHPDLKGMNLFKKITYIKKAVPVKVIKMKTVVEKNTNVSTSHWPLVPKEVLFKCDQCEIHFTNYAAATQHSASSSHKDQSGWKCQQCELSFIDTEKKYHLRQHDVTDTFKVYDAVLTMRNRMLCKCPECEFYLHEQDFWSHYENKCERRLGSDCFQCKAPIQQASVKFHNQLHKFERYSSKAMIWIEYVKVLVEAPGVPKEPTIGTYKKTKPAGYKLTISYCQNCKCCMIGKTTLQAHIAGNCASELVKKRRKICITCGLKFTYHKKCPMRCTGVKLDDMKFVRIQDQKIIKPPIPKYIKCEECGLNVCERLEIDLHDCEGVKKTCKYCQELFSDKAYRPHLALHEYRKAKRGAENKIELLKIQKNYIKLYKKKLSEIKKQPSSTLKRSLESIREVLKKIGNLVLKDQMQCSSKERNTCFQLWKCEDGLYFTSKDAAEAHASRRSAGNKGSIDNCSQCGRLFDTSELVKHLCKHHRNNMNVSFDVFPVSPIAYDEDSETDKFVRTEHSKKTGQKPHKNIVKNAEMKTTWKKKRLDILYKCTECQLHFHTLKTLEWHMSYTDHGASRNMVYCDVCGLGFTKKSLAIHTYLHRQNKHLALKDFKIFEYSKSPSGNVGIAESIGDSIVSPYRRPEGDVAISNRETRIKLYKCADCDVHFIAQNSCYKHTLNHRRMNPKEYIKCKICGLQFKIVTLSHHMHRHHKKESFKIEDVLIEEYRPDVLTNGAPKLNIYQASQSALDSTTKD